MLKKRKRRIRKIAVIAAPVVLLGTISFVTLLSRFQAHKSAFAYERYYDEYSDSEDEYNNNSLDFPEDSEDMDSRSSAAITGKAAVPDTDPDSITVLVNKELSLPEDYIPDDLVVPDVLFSISYFDEKKQLRKSAANALEKLFEAAEKDSVILYGVSGYRSYQRQYDIFTSNILKKGIEHTSKYSAKPGYSEHQTGLAIDVSAKSVNNRLDGSFADTEEGKWLAENAHLYGFIIRYPESKSAITGYAYEPWHIRYVGKALAAYLYKNDMCLEEYYNFKPSIDYGDDISYDNLIDYGIDPEDITGKQDKVTPTAPPVKETVEDTAEDTAEETGEDTVTATPVPTKKPTPTPSPLPTATPTPTEVPVPTVTPGAEVSPEPTQPLVPSDGLPYAEPTMPIMTE